MVVDSDSETLVKRAMNETIRRCGAEHGIGELTTARLECGEDDC